MSNPEEALFDSWQQGRKQGMSAGIRYEQERIIKRFEDCLCFDKYDCKDERCLLIMDFIALIKGEK